MSQRSSVQIGIVTSIFFLFSGPAAAKKPANRLLIKTDLLTWPRASVPEFGCFLERAFGAKDKRFNCALRGYQSRGDPCQETAAYYEGPRFPKDKSRQIHPLVEDIHLSWEHGELQGVQVTLTKRLDVKEVRRLFRLPVDHKRPPNVSAISLQACGKRSTCLLLEGLDHLGAGEVDCTEQRK
jgi:hypothetical protein